MVRCSECGKLQHMRCVKGDGCGELISPYICSQCQMFQIDPMSVPVLTIVRTFVVQSLKGTIKEKLKMLKFCKKDFTLDAPLKARIRERTNDVIGVEVRCVRLDGRGYVAK